jgi:hypothetical protein
VIPFKEAAESYRKGVSGTVANSWWDLIHPMAHKRNKEIRDNTLMKYIGLITLFGAMAFAGQPRKPACNAKVQGQFWPTEANTDRQVKHELYQSGELEMCSLVVWKYKWKRISVNVHELLKGKHPLLSTTPKTDDATR